MSAFAGLQIIELCETVAGEYCGKLLADLGAQVIKIERKGTGSPTRAMAPVLAADAGPDGSALFAYLNTSKRSVELDLADDADRDRLHRALADADAVIDDHGLEWKERAGISPEAAQVDYPHVVFGSITPYGLDAPAEMRHDKSINIFNASGWAYHTPCHADPELPPLKGAGRFLVDYEAGLDAAIALSAALWRAVGTGQGEYVDVSQQKALVSRSDSPFGPILAGEEAASDERRAYDMPGPNGFYPCRDGYVYLFVVGGKHWAGLKALLGDTAEFAAFEDDWLERFVTEEKIATFRTVFEKWLSGRDKAPASQEAQSCGVALVPVNDANDLRQSPQIQHRGYFRDVAHPVLGEASYPNVPYILSATPANPSPAPLLGEHNAQFASQDRSGRRSPVQAVPAAPRTARRPRGGPLAGVRIVELTKVWAGPYCGKLLSLLGAEVIKIESRNTLDDVRLFGGPDIDQGPIFMSVNPEILSAQMNLKSEQGMRCLHKLIRQSDVVINNIRPGAMERQGLGYEDLKAIREDIIAVSIKMYGNEGPLAMQTGFAPSFASLGGPNAMAGYAGGPPLGLNIRYGDSSAGAAAAFATMAALVHHRLTGRGQSVDVSAVEAMASLIGDSLLEQNFTGKALLPDGNRHADMAPHDCYPCAPGEWISIAVASDGEWRALCEVLGEPALAGDARFASLAARQANLHALDECVARMTAHWEAEALVGRLRLARIGAAKSASSRDLKQDALLWSQGFYREVSHKLRGTRPVIAASWNLARDPVEISRGAPDLGQDNDYVYRDIIGLSDAEMRDFAANGVID